MSPMLVLIAGSLLAGCASVPMMPETADREAKLFQPIADKSLIYLYRDELLGAGEPITVSLDGRAEGQTASRTYFLWVVSPGAHRILSLSGNRASLDLATEPGHVYFVWQEINLGLFTPGTTLHLVDEGQGRQAIMTCKRAEPL